MPPLEGDATSVEESTLLQRKARFCRGKAASAEERPLLQRKGRFCRGKSHSYHFFATHNASVLVTLLPGAVRAAPPSRRGSAAGTRQRGGEGRSWAFPSTGKSEDRKHKHILKKELDNT